MRFKAARLEKENEGLKRQLEQIRNQKPEVKDDAFLANLLNENVDGINLQTLLENLNKRIEVLLDKDHTIGHSYFMQVTNIEDLEFVFYNEIIPLLEEYFYSDYEKLQLVLGSEFVKKS